MTDFTRFAVIKTGWCDSYTGDEPVGNFRFFERGSGAERFNMLRTDNGFEVYCIVPVPNPKDREGWTIAHVAIDPADRKMKLVGWYEEATFLGATANRTGKGRGEDSNYSIRAAKAFEIPSADRPILDHNGQLKSTRIGWLRGEETATDWAKVARRLRKLIETSKSVAANQLEYKPADARKILGETANAALSTAGLLTDDGGVPYGRSAVAESAEHKALKEWACNNPGFFGARSANGPGHPEFNLPSGDQVDAVHVEDSAIWLVEVKSRRSGERDLERGIYQCVKYRAVYEAMQIGLRETQAVHAVLLTERKLSDRLSKLAKRHRITTLTHFCKVPA